MNDIYLNFSLNIAKQAGEIMRSNFSHGMEKEWKEDNTPVTQTDLAINKLLLDSVKREFPDHSVLAEEESSFSYKSEYVWVCDPVDGTIPFSHGIPTFVFSLALVCKGETLLGVIYDPIQDRMYTAQGRKGACLNNKSINVSDKKEIKGSVISISWWKNKKFNLYPLGEKLRELGAKIIDVNSVTYEMALVSCGELAAVIFPGIKSHDSAAGQILIEEAGGTVTNFFGEKQRYDREIDGFLAANTHLHSQILELLTDQLK